MIQPKIIDIELTNACNRECTFCLRSFMKRRVGAMDIGLFKRIIDELCSFDFPQWGKVVLAGFGEPTLHPRFIEAVDYAASRGLPLRIYTNASRLNTRVRRCLLQDGIKSVKISLNAHGPELFQKITGSAASWEKTVNGICALMTDQLLQKSKTEITLQLLYSADIDPQLKTKEKPVLDTPAAAKAAIEFWQSKTAEIFAAARLKNEGQKDRRVEGEKIRKNYKLQNTNYKQITNYNVRNYKGGPKGLIGPPCHGAPGRRRQKTKETLFENFQIKLCPYLPYTSHFDPSVKFPSGLDFRQCRRHFNNIVIFHDGSCTPCCTDVQCQLYLGNINQSTVLEVFNSERANKNRRLWQEGQPPHQLCGICLKKSI